MKDLNVNNRIIQYEIHYEDNGYDTYYYTSFYEGTKEVTTRKYWLFGKKTIKLVPNFIFYLDINIESENYTRDEIRRKVEYKLELLGRLQEIYEGRII